MKDKIKKKTPPPVLTVDQEGDDFLHVTWTYDVDPWLFILEWNDGLIYRTQQIEGFNREFTVALLDFGTTYTLKMYVYNQDQTLVATSNEVTGTTRVR